MNEIESKVLLMLHNVELLDKFSQASKDDFYKKYDACIMTKKFEQLSMKKI